VLRPRDGRWHWHWDPRLLDSRRPWLDDPGTARQAQVRLRSLMAAGAAALRVPTLLVRGGSSDLVTPEAAAELATMIPHADLVDVTGAGHMVAGDRNDPFTEAVLRFAAPLAG
jgi:pimeloyl-ACP methyl ester carboxylesterase